MNNENYVNNIKENMATVKVDVVKGTSKKGNTYEAVKLTIGEYETLIFPSKFEMKYIKDVL